MGDTISWDDVFKKAQDARKEGDGGSKRRQRHERSGGGGGGGGGPRGPKSPTIDYTRFKHHSKRWWIIAAIIFVVIVAFCYWWFHPSLNIHSADLWWFISFFVCLPAFLIFYILSGIHSHRAETQVASQAKAVRYKRLSWIPVAIVAVGLLGALASATFFPFNARRYANVLQTTEYDFAQDIEQVDYSQIPVIDYDSAVLLGNRAMGSIPDYVSQFTISDLYSQINYHDTPVRVSPLNYADFFKWITNRNPGIPAYVLVDMTTQDVEIVRLDEAMKYTQSEPFCRNIDRYVQLRYPFYMFEQLAFEVDEDGHPWWICPVQTRTIGLFGGETISRVVLVDACTGECTDLAIQDCPEWVDRAYPSELLIQQYNWSGRYINGWWNSFIGQSGVKQTTPGTDNQLGYNYIAKDDDVWVYTGVTSATADNSIIGFVLINQRTAESHFYSVAGATEDSAMSSAEGQVQNLEYTATFPLLINVDGQPTYFMALKDAAGLVKKYAMIDIQRYQNVAVGDTVNDCQVSYKALLQTNGVLTEDESAQESALSSTGTVARISTAVIDGNSHFYLMLEGDSRIYDCALPGLVQVVTLEAGDTVTLSYIDGSPTCSVTELTMGDAGDAGTGGTASSSSTTGTTAAGTAADTTTAAGTAAGTTTAADAAAGTTDTTTGSATADTTNTTTGS